MASEPVPPDRPLRILSLGKPLPIIWRCGPDEKLWCGVDGGGARGLSTLYTLKFIMQGLENVEQSGASRPLRPCDYFDLIAGTSSGGLITLMLGVFRMTIHECIDEWETLAPAIFPKKTSTLNRLAVSSAGLFPYSEKPLELAVKNLVQKYLGEHVHPATDPPLAFEATADKKSPRCKVFVNCTSDLLGAPVLLRNYQAPWSLAPEATICQAARATCAAPTFLPPVYIDGVKYVNGAMACPNPIFKAREEAKHLWPEQALGCIVSIGTGLTSLVDVGSSPSSLVKFAVDKMTRSDEAAHLFETDVLQCNGGHEQKIYFRFNVARGLEGMEIDEISKAPNVKAATMNYLEEIWAKMDACVTALLGRLACPDTNAQGPKAFRTAREWNVPRMDNQHFTGRQSILDSIEKHFKEKETRLVLWGMPGIGKTEIALKYAYLTRRSYPATYWISGETQNSLQMGLQRVQRPKTGEKLLIIIDDINTSDNDNVEYLHRALPCSEEFDILLTTRSDSSSKLMSETLEVGCLKETEAIELLKRLTPRRSPCEEEDEIARRLMAHLGDLPLAISQCAGYINNTRTSFRDYPEDPEEFLSQTLGNTVFVQRLNAGKKQIFSTFEVIWDHLGREDPEARELMCLLSMFTREISIHMLHGGLTEHKKWFPTGEYKMAAPYYLLPFLQPVCKAPHLLDQMIGILCDFNMAQRLEDTIIVHSVVHWYTGWRLAQNYQKSEQVRLQAMAILQHAQNLGETMGKAHLSSELHESVVWGQAARLLVTSSQAGGGQSPLEVYQSTHPDLLREFTRLLLYIPRLSREPRSIAETVFAYKTRRERPTRGSPPHCLPHSHDFWRSIDDPINLMWNYSKNRLLALTESLISKCDDPSLWLEAVVVGSEKSFAEYRGQGLDFFFHRNLHSYLGKGFSAQRKRWTACDYPFLPRIIYSLASLEEEAVRWWLNDNPLYVHGREGISWPDISWSSVTGMCHKEPCKDCLGPTLKFQGRSEEILRQFLQEVPLPERGQLRSDLDHVTFFSRTISKALWLYIYVGDYLSPDFEKKGPDDLCASFIMKGFTIILTTASWSIEDGFVFFRLREFARNFRKHAAPRSDRIIDCLLAAACLGESLSPMNSPAIANLCGVWIQSLWIMKGQTAALKFANSVIRKRLRPILETRIRKQSAMAFAVWIPYEKYLRGIENSNPPNLRIVAYDLDPATHLQRFIEVLSQCSNPTDHNIVWDAEHYMLPLAYLRDGCLPNFMVHISSEYQFIYSNEENPGFRHLLYNFQDDALVDLKTVLSQTRCRNLNFDPTETVPASSHYLISLRYTPPFPQFGFDGDKDIFRCGNRAPPIPIPSSSTTPSSDDAQVEKHVLFYVIT